MTLFSEKMSISISMLICFYAQLAQKILNGIYSSRAASTLSKTIVLRAKSNNITQPSTFTSAAV